MTKLKLTTLLFMLSFLIVSSHAANISIIQTENVPVVMTAETQHSGDDKSGSMLANINGHTLTIAFTENLGEVSIEVQNGDGVPVDLSIMDTPTGCKVWSNYEDVEGEEPDTDMKMHHFLKFFYGFPSVYQPPLD